MDVSYLDGPLAQAMAKRVQRTLENDLRPHRLLHMSLPEVAAVWKECGPAAVRAVHAGDDYWCGGSNADLSRMFEEGNTACVEGARKLVDSLTKRIKRPIPANMLAGPAVAGGRVHVPSYLAGLPTTFRRNDVPNPSAIAPVRVFASLSATCSFSSTQLDRRGAAIAAFAMMLGKQRPCELYAYSYGRLGGSDRDNTIVVVRLGLTPLDWPRICTAFAGNFFRRAGFALELLAMKRVGNGHEPGPHGSYHNDPERLRQALAATPHDIIVSDMHSAQHSDSEAWIEGMLKKAA